MNPVNVNQEINEENNPNNRPPETDSERIVHRHMQNKDDIITDEDIRNIRVGVPDEQSMEHSQVQAILKDAAEKNKNETSE